MRVVHVTPYFAPAFVYGGPPRSILALCQGLQAANVEVEVITTVANGSADLPASRADGPPDQYAGVAVRYARRAFPKMFFNAAVRQPIRTALAHADVCHIHGLWTVPAWQAARAATRMGVPFVISPRGMLHPAAFRRRAWKKRIAFEILEHRHLTAAAAIHATVDEEAAIVREFIPSARIVTIPNAVDVGPAERTESRLRQRLGVAPDAPLVAFLGRLHPIKRLDLLLDAFASVRVHHPSAVLILAGPDEGGLQLVERQRRQLGTSVKLAGAVGDDEKWALLSEAAALVLCSDSENFGVSVVEAMASGCPVVATQTCPWSEIEEHGAGRWVPQDAGAIAAAVASIIADPALKASMGERGVQLARSRYALDAVGAAMADCYADILSRKRRVA